MRKYEKKVFLIGALFSMICLWTFGAKASERREILDSGKCGENLTWTLYEGDNLWENILEISGTGDMYNYESTGDWDEYIPDPETPPWYDYLEDIISINITNGITSVGNFAFEGAHSVSKIELPETLRTIGKGAFGVCNAVPEIHIPDGVTFIDEYAFYNGSSLTEVYIPSSLANIPVSAFEGCGSFTIYGNKGSYAEKFAWQNGIPFLEPGEEPAPPIEGQLGQGKCGDNLDWVVTTGGLLKISGTGEMWDRPSSRNTPWRKFIYDIVDVTMEEGITSIGDNAFGDLYRLSKVKIPNSVRRIGQYVFDGASIDEIILPNGIQEIGDYAFSNSGIDEITIPDSVIRIGKGAFEYTGLWEVTMSANMIQIDDGAFYDCLNLIEVTIPGADTIIGKGVFEKCPENLIIYGVSGSLAESYASENNHIFKLLSEKIPPIEGQIGSGNCGGNSSWLLKEDGTFIISGNGEMDNYNNTSSCPWERYKNKIQEVTIESGITSIGESAFSDCSNLVKVSIPASVNKIGKRAFSECSSLNYINLPIGVKVLEDFVFSGCRNLTGVEMSGISMINQYAFSGCSSLKEINIPEGVTTISSGAFSSCERLESVRIPSTVRDIQDFAFSYCTELKQISLPTGIVRIAQYTFSHCENLKEVFIPKTVKEIEGHALEECIRIEKIEIPDGVESLGDYAFGYCENLKIVKIPKSVTQFKGFVFPGCDDLTIYGYQGSAAEIYANNMEIPMVFIDEGETPESPSTEPEIPSTEQPETQAPTPETPTTETQTPETPATDNLIINKPTNNTPSVTQPSTETQDEKNFKSLPEKNKIYKAGNAKYIVTRAIDKNGTVSFVGTNNKKLASVTIPNTIKINGYIFKVTKISKSAFKNNQYLKKVKIGSNVQVIESKAFANCKKLMQVTLGSRMTTIGDSAFQNCTALKKVTIPSRVTTIGKSAFRGCTKLTSVVMGSRIKKIGIYAFYGDKRLRNVTVKSTILKSVGKQCFGKTYDKVIVKVPKKKLNNYRKLLKNKGLSKDALIKK